MTVNEFVDPTYRGTGGVQGDIMYQPKPCGDAEADGEGWSLAYFECKQIANWSLRDGDDPRERIRFSPAFDGVGYFGTKAL